MDEVVKELRRLYQEDMLVVLEKNIEKFEIEGLFSNSIGKREILIVEFRDKTYKISTVYMKADDMGEIYWYEEEQNIVEVFPKTVVIWAEKKNSLISC